MNNRTTKRNRGITLVEVAVTIAVVMLILTALISAVSHALSASQFSRNKTIAAKYAQEMVEWLRTERSKGWSGFIGYSSVGGQTYCFNSSLTVLPPWPDPSNCSSVLPIDDAYDIFKREVRLTTTSSDSVTLNVTITWPQGNRQSDVTVTSILTNW